MRLNVDAPLRAFTLLGLSIALGACAIIPRGGDRLASAEGAAMPTVERTGPAADFPQVLGQPYTVDGQEYVPADTASYDAVGFASFDREGGQGVTVAHKTLPMPSYVEVTSLETGRTILARVERRGPMSSSRIVGLSQAAQMQLGSREGTPVRVRRVNPPENERAELRAGRVVKERMDTPKSLLAVLQRKLESEGATSLPNPQPAPPQAAPVRTATAPTRELPPVNAPLGRAPVANGASFDTAFNGERKTSTAYPLRPLASTPIAVAQPGAPVLLQPTRPAAPRASVQQAPVAQDGDFVVQAAAFSNRANAERAANIIGGFVMQAGSYFRVRTGPYATRGQAEAALAKVRAAGYSDARVFTAG